MKYLTHYIEDKQTEAFRSAGAFFCFSQDQFESKKVDGVQYVSLGAGLICPADKVKTLVATLDKVHAEGIAQDIAENGIKAIIHRELGNHEYSYTYDCTDTIMSLEGYPITADEIRAEAKLYLIEYLAWEESQEATA